ncbi:Uncharacterized protein HZ326_16385 [Fusarium oxysporum f. sp. albedinis]|nr:Uncharacterized protein HZ326_16385 [Fusarium oxysporum f. sp. albedinis]
MIVTQEKWAASTVSKLWDRFNCINILYIRHHGKCDGSSLKAGLGEWPQAHIHVLEGHGGPESRDPNTANLFTAFEDGEKLLEVWVGITQNVVGGLGVRTSKGREICDAHAPRLHETSWGLADHFQGPSPSGP